MCIPCIYKKEPEKKSVAVKVIVAITAVVGAATLICLIAKYFMNKYHEDCCALCHDDDCDCDGDDSCDFEDCDCGCCESGDESECDCGCDSDSDKDDEAEDNE